MTNRYRVLFFIFLFSASLVFSQDSASESRTLEETKRLRKTYKSKNTAEKIVSFPGKVVMFPVDIGLKGIKYSIQVYDETKIGPKIVDLMTADNGLRGVVPTYASRTGAGINFYQKDLVNTGSKFSFTATMGLEKEQKIEADFSSLKLGHDMLQARLNAAYVNLAGEHFYGMGPDSDLDNEFTFGHARKSGDASIGFNFHEKFYLNATFGIESNEMKESSDHDDLSLFEPSHWPDTFGNHLPGIFDTVNLSSFRVEFGMDTKDKQGNPTKGMDAFFSSGIYDEYDGDVYGFTKTIADVSKYIHLFYGRVLALRAATQITSSRNGGEIPFYLYSELGNDETIRGFQRGRFRDKDYLLGSVEYRFPFTRNVDALVFTDAGKVSSDIADEFDSENWNVTYGGGLRFYSESSLIARIELGKSSDGFRLLVKLN
jgi:hypothetical protein